MRWFLYKVGVFLIKTTETYVYHKCAGLKDRIIVPNRLTGEIEIWDAERNTTTIYEVKDGIICYERFFDNEGERTEESLD